MEGKEEGGVKKLFLSLMARALEATTQEQIDTLCGDIDRLYQQEKIKWDEHEMLFRLINKLQN